MKPVNLVPSDLTVASAEPGKPNLGMIGGAAAGFIAIVGVAGYFAMARVDTVKSETQAATTRAAQATQETTSIQSQVQTLGSPVVDSDKQLAQGAETILVAAYTERHDFVLLAKELRAIMEGTGGWYETVEATSATGTGERSVKIVGFMPTKELLAGFNERANGTQSLANAETILIESERLSDVDSRRPGIYFGFTMEADLVDKMAPSAGGDSGIGADSSGTTVADGGSGELKLSLDPEPRPTPVAPKAPAKPKNPFDVAATMAGGAK